MSWRAASVSRTVATLEPGDLIATGTPEGIGPLSPGDRVEVELAGVGVVGNPVVSDLEIPAMEEV